METFGKNLSEKKKSTLDISSRRASQRKDEEDAKFIHKKGEEDANKLSFETGPWWRLADGEDLVSLVSQRSLNLIENCDLPQPQSSFSRRGHAGNFPLSLHLNARTTSNAPSLREPQDLESDLTKAELLEALCHCQTRAREAERLVSEAYAEKEHILKLFFQQASHLFAYKQWFQLLQLENIQFQNKLKGNSDNDDDNDRETVKTDKMKKIPSRRKRIRKHNKNDYATKMGVGFAIGFGLIGAGLLLGWTIGWIFPLF